MIAVTVTPPEVVGVLAWWGVVLAAPAILVRRFRRRRKIAPQREVRVPSHTISTAVTTEHLTTPRQTVHASGPTPELRLRPSGCADTLAFRAEASDLGEGERSEGRDDRLRRESVAVPRLSPQTLEPLSRYVDFHRRLELAVSELDVKLCRLPPDRWRIEPYPLTGERRNTLLVMGATGVFVISATYAPGHWDDVLAVNQLARKIQRLLPGYPGEVQPAICHPFSNVRPRLWHRPDEHGEWIGSWLIGGDSVLEWLGHFGFDLGLAPADLSCFDRLARPDWLKSAIPTPPTWPRIPDVAPPRSED